MRTERHLGGAREAYFVLFVRLLFRDPLLALAARERGRAEIVPRGEPAAFSFRTRIASRKVPQIVPPLWEMNQATCKLTGVAAFSPD